MIFYQRCTFGQKKSRLNFGSHSDQDCGSEPGLSWRRSALSQCSLFCLCRGRINGGGDINSLGLLPDKLKTELALHVNLETLRKVLCSRLCSFDGLSR